jgi:simple sugar transport system ATP-binding protein
VTKGEVLARFEGVGRRFGDVVAVADASLEIRAGEVLAVLGENGAGKSTLMKLLYGTYPVSEGTIHVAGADGGIAGPVDARRYGIGMVFQHFSLLPALSVRDNLLLAWPQTPFWKSRRNRRIEAVLAPLRELAPHLSPDARVGELSVGEQQAVELAKVLNISARIVILDEPTAVLTPAEALRLHGFIRHLADGGAAVVLITHKLADVEACADRIAVMRRGRIVDMSDKGARSMADIVTLMMGAAVEGSLPTPATVTSPVERLVVQGLSVEAPGQSIETMSFGVRRGEVFGIAGVAGNGQTLLAEALAGVRTVSAGDVLLEGMSIARRSEFEALATPLGYVPEQPRENAVVETMSLAENLQLRELAAGRGTDRPEADMLVRFRVNPTDPALAAGALSGGNLQKLVAAREFGVPREAVLACYPTMGLDLTAIELVYSAMFEQAAHGAAVVWISEDLDHLIACAHRIAVIREGRLVAISDNDGTLTRDAIGAMMTGMSAGAGAAVAA